MPFNSSFRVLADARTGEHASYPLTELVEALPAVQLPDGIWVVPLQLADREEVA